MVKASECAEEGSPSLASQPPLAPYLVRLHQVCWEPEAAVLQRSPSPRSERWRRLGIDGWQDVLRRG